MEEKNVVSIEDRIPKLKQTRRKKANRRLILYLSVLFLLIATVVYLQSPLSHIRNILIEGNQHVSADVVRSISNLDPDTNFWQVDTEKVELELEMHEEISEAHVNRQFPGTIEIVIKELSRIGYVQADGQFKAILEDGTYLESSSVAVSGDAPILVNFSKATYLKEMSKELKQLPKSVTHLISEIHWDPKEDNPYYIRLYMNDGFQVRASIRNFSSKMPAYPSIVSQLSEGKDGIIHIDVGAYFEEYPESQSEREPTYENQG